MDSNDPTNPNPNIPGGTPAPSVNPDTAAPGSSWPGTPIGNPSSTVNDGIISDVTPIPPAAVTPPQAPAANPWDSPAASTPGFTPPAPADATNTPSAQTPWQSSAPPAASASDVPVAAAAPPEAANPFLQPNAGSSFAIPQSAFNQEPPAQAPIPPQESGTTIPNPAVGAAPDPLNTAFSQTGAPPANPFAQATPTDPQNLGAIAPQSEEPAPASPWDQPAPQAPAQQSPIDTTGNTMATPGQPNLTPGQPGTADNPDIRDQTVPETPQQPPLDLSSLQSNPGASPQPLESQPGNPQAQDSGVPSQPAATTPGSDTGPVENAPTDLSHLIAGDEQPANSMGNVYNPPVAPDQNPALNNPQIPTPDSQTPPPGKHLNLTKVLLVAGIPIILVVAALSAYLILGIGKSAPAEDQTSLPVEQTTPEQAPLTNPPSQIVAPSPAVIPEPAADTSLPSEPLPVASPSPSSSPLSAMDKLKARQSSPSPATSASPAASTSTSLPQ